MKYSPLTCGTCGRSLTIAIGLLLGLTSCSGLVPQQIDLKEPPFSCPLFAAAPPSLPVRDVPLDIEVHIDGSGSMLGYVPATTEGSVSEETIYTNTLETLHQIFTIPRENNPTLQYFRTGLNLDTQKRIEKFNFSDRAVNRLNPLTQDFYNDRLTSQLQAAITPPQSDRHKLLVLISDLDQDSGAIENVTKAIKDSFFTPEKSGYGIALMGIRSQFNGQVYSTDPTKIKNFAYSSQKSTSTYRPFYLLWVGPVADLNQYLPQVVEKIEKRGGVAEVSLFSPTDWQADFQLNPQTDPELPDGLSQSTLKKGKAVIIQDEQTPGHLFRLLGRSTDILTVNYEVTSQAVPSPYLVNVGEITPAVKGWTFNDQAPLERSSSEVSAELALTNLKPEGQSLKFDLVFQSPEIETGSLSVYRFDLVASDLTAPDWWSDWDWDKRDNNQDGTKTYQLSRFTDSLGTIAFDAMGEDKTIGRVCFAVQK